MPESDVVEPFGEAQESGSTVEETGLSHIKGLNSFPGFSELDESANFWMDVFSSDLQGKYRSSSGRFK